MRQVEYRECRTVPGKFGNVTIGFTVNVREDQNMHDLLDETKRRVRQELEAAISEAGGGYSDYYQELFSLREENKQLKERIKSVIEKTRPTLF